MTYSNNGTASNNKSYSSSHLQQDSSLLKSFISKAEKFMKNTEQQALQGLNPGGIYQAIWCRDASFILRSWFHLGNIHGLLQQLSIIWSHQIAPGKEKIIYGRGSPEMDYKPTVAKQKEQKKFEGALPTTIYQTGFSEVYGLNPDIDSTALMIYTTSWILAKIIKQEKDNSSIKDSSNTSSSSSSPRSSSTYDKKTPSFSEAKSMTKYPAVIDFVVPCMSNAVDHLVSRDIDNDGLLEQNHNEDWMDTALRAGKIVYSQACWILSLNCFSYLLSELGKHNEAERMARLADRTITAVEEKLWSEEDGCYIDFQESHHIGGPYRTLTQDVSLYLVAISENTNSDSLRIHHNMDGGSDLRDNSISNISSGEKIGHRRQSSHPLKQQKDNYPQGNDLEQLLKRANSTLDNIRKRVWLDNWPANVEALLKRSGPWHLKPYFYHNRTFWPWITGIEMLARSRFNRVEECNILLSKLASKDDLHILTFYEWANPKTGKGGGSYPFRTGICTVRMAIDHIVSALEQNSTEKA